MTRKRFYLMLAIVGFVIPYYFFVSFLLANGPDGRLFLHQLFGAPISTFFAVDLLLSCVIFVGYMSREAARHSIRNQWVYILALLLVGLSFAWPLFLFKLEAERESKLVETASTETQAATNR